MQAQAQRFAPAEALPVTFGLPDIFRTVSREKVTTIEGWRRRREEIAELLQYYQYGRMPPRPDQVTAEVTETKPHASKKGTEQWLTLSIGSSERLAMRAVLYRPRGAGLFPVVIREEGTLGRTKQIPMFLEKGYMFIEYARHDLDPDQAGVTGPAQKAYPEYDWATLAVWAWGGMRVVDYLETRSDVDLKRIAITGHSRGGKMALLAGALDERFALVAPNGSGAGGAGSYRILGPGAESLGMNDKPHWYHDRLMSFSEREERLPFDQHFLKALVAPRALLCTESLDDAFANPLGTQATSMAVRDVYRFLDADGRRNGLHFRRGPHDSNTEDWQALLDFAEWHFFGRKPGRPDRFWHAPFDVPDNLLHSNLESSNVERSDKSSITEHDKNEAQRTITEWIAIGDAGNPPDTNYYGHGRFGSVAYRFEIAKHQVTNRQYAAFLNSVARADPHALYHPRMGNDAHGGIERVGSSGNYAYEVKRDVGNKPVTFVSWFDAIRYCNWMHNGRPSDPQNEHTTEDGAYSLGDKHGAESRNAGAKFFLPSENEWYKAAYFDPRRGSTGEYRLFAVDSNRTRVVAFAAESESAYGVAEMADDVWEWTQPAIGGLFRGLRSGSWFQGNNQQAAGRFYSNPNLELHNVGFRVAKK